MSRSVTFNGITRFRPGGITRINADALNRVGLTTGTLALVGEAEGGRPGDGTLSGLVSVRSPADAVDLFRSGPIVDAIRLAFQSSGDPLVPGGASEVVIYKTNHSTQSSVHLPSETESIVVDTADAASTTVVINLTTGGLAVDSLVGRWVDLEVTGLVGLFRRRIVSNTASSITVTPALPAAPTAGDDVHVRATWAVVSSRDYGAHTASIEADLAYNSVDETYTATVNFEGNSQVSPALGGQNRIQMTYVGGPVAASHAAAALPSTTATTISVTASYAVLDSEAGKTVRVTIPALGVSEQHRILGNTDNAGPTEVITLEGPGFSASFLAALQTAAGATVEVVNVTNAVATVVGSAGVATSLTTTITGVTGDNLSIAFGPSTTIRQVIDQINLNTNYYAVVPNGVNPDTALARDLDFGANTVTNIQKDVFVNGGAGLRADAFDVVSWFNQAEDTVAVRFSSAPLDGHGIDGADLNDGAPSGGDYPYRLFGGTRGTSSNADFQTALDTLLLRTIDDVAVLVDEDLINEGNGSTATWNSVAAQLAAHVTLARGAAGLERGAFIGFRGSKAQIIAAANSLNDTDVQLVAQNPTVLDASGSLVEKGPRELAVMAASMRLGVQEIGEPLTGKFLRAANLTQHSSWDPRSLTDSADMIRAGVLFAEVVPGRGVRWVRDLTTYVQTDNLAYTEGSVRDIVRFVAYDLRTYIEDRFTGRKAKPATIRSIKDTAVERLDTYRAENLIVDSTDLATGQVIRAYHNLQVISSGDVVKLNVGIFPVPGINFQLHDIFLQLPTQSA